jgi:hypothetical protein
MGKKLKNSISVFLLLFVFFAACLLLYRDLSKIFSIESIYSRKRYVLDLEPEMNKAVYIRKNSALKFVIIGMGTDFAAAQLAADLPISSVMIFTPTANNTVYWMKKIHDKGHIVMLEIGIDREEAHSLSSSLPEQENNLILRELLEDVPEYVSLYIDQQSPDLLLQYNISNALLAADRAIYRKTDYGNRFDTNTPDSNDFSVNILEKANAIAEKKKGLVIFLKADSKSMIILHEWIKQYLNKD